MYIDPPFIKKLKANVDGRDFVVGDLHGCFDELVKLLKYVKFDVEKDRLFSTGDLLDRGPKSLDCMSLLPKKWFFPVLGNHEDILLSKIKMLEKNQNQNFSKEDIDFLEKVKIFEKYIYQMPLAYDVEHMIHEKVFIIHAEILPEHLGFGIDNTESLEYQVFFDSMRKFDFSNQIKSFFQGTENNQLDYSLKQKLIWSRKIIASFYKNHKDEIDNEDFSFMNDDSFNQKIKIFCGHNVVPFPIKINQQYYIDTGAALGYSSKEINSNLFSQFGHEFFALSMVDLTTGICYGCITSQEQRGQILKLENSIYNK